MKTTYKQIIKNLVEKEVEDFIEKRIDRYFPFISDDDVELKQDKDFDYPHFKVIVKIDHQKYEINGFVTKYGHSNITSIDYEYDYYETYDDIAKGNKKHKVVTVYGDELKTFNFNK